MTSLQLNAELFRQLSIIAEDEGLMKKAIKVLKKITAKKRVADETDYIMSSPAMVDILRQGDPLRGEQGKWSVIPTFPCFSISFAYIQPVSCLFLV